MSSRRKSNTLRFAVGTPQKPDSFIWRMWVQRDEVYLGARDALTIFKVSLHNSGIWRIAFVADLQRPDCKSDRVILKWKRPQEFAPGWTPSIAIVVSAIQPKHPFTPRKIYDDRVLWFAAPSEGRKLLFKVLFSIGDYSEDDIRPFTSERHRIAARMVKENGEAVWLVVRDEVLSPLETQQIQDAMAKTKIHLKAGSTGESINARILLMLSEDQPSVSTQPTILDIPLGKENLAP